MEFEGNWTGGSSSFGRQKQFCGWGRVATDTRCVGVCVWVGG